jgi:cysteinyl-tRNA synthetase
VQTPGRPFVKHWLHGAHLLVEGKKMSKSLGNYFTVRDLVAKGYTGREVRTLLLSAHFRETFNFTLAGLDGARAQLARIDECLAKLRELAARSAAGLQPAEAGNCQLKTGSTLVADFTAALDDDLNVSKAWAVVFDWVRDTNRALAEGQLSAGQAAAALLAWAQLDSVFGLGAKASEEAPAEIVALANERVAAKKSKDFARADAIRNELKAKGWVVEDTPKGPKLKRA